MEGVAIPGTICLRPGVSWSNPDAETVKATVVRAPPSGQLDPLQQKRDTKIAAQRQADYLYNPNALMKEQHGPSSLRKS